MLRFGRVLLHSAKGRLEASAIRCVASDMDGTILGVNHTLSERTKRTLFTLTQERNIPFVFATGRVHADVAVVNEHLQEFFRVVRAKRGMQEDSRYTATPVYLISSNGAVAHDARTGEVVLEECIPKELVRELYTLLPASETRINTHLCQQDRWYCRMDWAEMLQFHQESGFTFQVLEKIPVKPDAETEHLGRAASLSSSSFAEAAQRGAGAKLASSADTRKENGGHHDTKLCDPAEGDVSRVTKVSFTSWDKPLLDTLEVLLHKRYGDALTISYSASYAIDITKKGTNKASALRSVLSLLPPAIRSSAQNPLNPALEVASRMARTIAFGNDLNDAAMLLSAGQGFLMGNSNPRLMQQCAGMEVIGNHVEDGVARKLCEIFDIQSGASSNE